MQYNNVSPNGYPSNPFRDRVLAAQQESGHVTDAPPAYSTSNASPLGFAPPTQAVDCSSPGLYSNQNFVNEKGAPMPHSSTSSLQVPQAVAGPSSRSAPPSSGSRFKGPTATDLLNPPPPGFSRAPPFHELMTQPFRPFSLLSIDSGLNKGFPLVAPPSAAQPHPFIVHDVKEEDWTRLLHDIQAAGKLSPLNKIVAGVAPAAMGIGIFPGLLVTRVIENKMRRKKQGIVSNIIDNWNHYFFHPRCIEVTLAQGHVVHAGASGPPPDMPQLHSTNSSHGRPAYFHAEDAYPDSSDSSDSSDSDSDHTTNDKRTRREQKRIRKEQKRAAKHDAKMDKLEWKREKRANKIERKRRRRELKDVRTKPWRLIISFRPYQA